jgi:hypothetical protein
MRHLGRQNDGHLDQLRVAIYYLSGFPVNTPNTPFFYHQINARGFLRRMCDALAMLR